jgi:hypothetical protein
LKRRRIRSVKLGARRLAGELAGELFDELLAAGRARLVAFIRSALASSSTPEERELRRCSVCRTYSDLAAGEERCGACSPRRT